MLTAFVSVFVPLCIYIVLPKFLGDKKSYRWLLLLSCIIFTVSWYIPSPKIDGMQTQFMTHFFGGGVFSGLLWLYCKLIKKWKVAHWIEAASLFTLVSSLGVLNELFEYVLYHFGLMPLGISDTSWDLVANTLGASLFFVAYLITKYYVSYRRA